MSLVGTYNWVVNAQQCFAVIWYHWTQGYRLPCVQPLRTQFKIQRHLPSCGVNVTSECWFLPKNLAFEDHPFLKFHNRTDIKAKVLNFLIFSFFIPSFLRYNDFLEVTPVENIEKIVDGTNLMKINGKLCLPTRLPNGLYKFKADTGFDR